MKAVIVKAREGVDLKVGEEVDIPAREFTELLEGGYVVTASEWSVRQQAQRQAEAVKAAAEQKVKDAVKAAKERGAVAPKDDTVEAKALADVRELDHKPQAVEMIVKAVEALRGKPAADTRLTTSSAPGEGRVETGDIGFRETVKAYLHADEPFLKTVRQGGIVRAAHSDEHQLKLAVEASKERAIHMGRMADMIKGGANLSASELRDVVKATAIAYSDESYIDSSLGALNTGLLLQSNLGFLEYQLAMLDDVTTDISSQPALWHHTIRSRYITIPKVMLKTDALSWNATAQTGTAVDVNVVLDTHAGVPLSIGNMVLGSTPRQLFNEQRQPQLYALGQYIIYKLLDNVWNGNIRYANAGTKSTITFNPGYTNAAGGHTFSMAGATAGTFVADLPEAMDESQFPGGDEAPGAADLSRFIWVHGRAYATLAGDKDFLYNQSIWGAMAGVGGNLLSTGRYERVGNSKIRKSQLCTDQVTVTGSGADATTNGIVVTPGTFASSTYIGFCGTRSSLLFVSRVPQDYTKVLPDVPSTAAIELVTEPRTGLTFMVVKFLDHAYETANMRVQLMFGTAIGDERQGMLLTRV